MKLFTCSELPQHRRNGDRQAGSDDGWGWEKGLGLRGLAGSYGRGEDSSGFTQGRVSPRGDRRMSASVRLCLSSKPCQRRLCQRSITALSLRVSFWLMIPDSATGFTANLPGPLSPGYESRVRHLACEHARAHASASASTAALSDSVSEVQPGGGSL
ncbi:unnamed protein product [Pleuronectes platessa]|uniref:Uncharacterized protein n=1 Tax=Pleuronectes platessa TaxID=8262 RepID=A0A9N7Z1Y7_PLEPL|nr:unnamed protein product [Pleuronectes platessa]